MRLPVGVLDAPSIRVSGANNSARPQLIPEETTQYDPELNENDGLVVIDLDEPMGTHGSPDDEDTGEE